MLGQHRFGAGEVMDIVKDWWIVPISFISQFATEPGFIATIAARGRPPKWKSTTTSTSCSATTASDTCKEGDLIQLLPLRQKLLRHAHGPEPVLLPRQCFATSRLVAAELGLSPDRTRCVSR
jgi:ferrochelatase